MQPQKIFSESLLAKQMLNRSLEVVDVTAATPPPH